MGFWWIIFTVYIFLGEQSLYLPNNMTIIPEFLIELKKLRTYLRHKLRNVFHIGFFSCIMQSIHSSDWSDTNRGNERTVIMSVCRDISLWRYQCDGVNAWCHGVVFSGAVLLDLKQRTLPGIAQQVVEQMVISDQIKAEDRANVLKALLLRHRFMFKIHLSVHLSVHTSIIHQSIYQLIHPSIQTSICQSIIH